MTIPVNASKIRPVLSAGWSSNPTKQAITWFDSVYLINSKKPVMSDQNLKAELVVKGLESPTSMAFLGPNDILVLEKNKGTVQRIVNGVKLSEPLIDLDVANTDGLLGIAIEKNMTTNQKDVTKNSTYVFLYFTASKKEDQDTKVGISTTWESALQIRISKQYIGKSKTSVESAGWIYAQWRRNFDWT